jgi:hypothetical protein
MPCENSTYWYFLKYNTDAFNSNHENKENLGIICLTAKQNVQYNSALSILAFLSEDNSLGVSSLRASHLLDLVQRFIFSDFSKLNSTPCIIDVCDLNVMDSLPLPPPLSLSCGTLAHIQVMASPHDDVHTTFYENVQNV